MQDTNKALTQLVRSMKRTLKTQHGIEVPHAALRASLLLAQGENPHAYAAGQAREPAQVAASDNTLRQLISEAPKFFHPGYDFDGEKLDWLERAGLVAPAKASKQTQRVAASQLPLRRVYLCGDDLGMLNRLSLDEDGYFMIPQDWEFGPECEVTFVQASIPKVSKYGLPVYLAEPAEFFRSLNLNVAPGFRSRYEDLGDDSGDSGWISVHISDEEWKLLLQVLFRVTTLKDQVSEWVGQHYGRNYVKEPERAQYEWVERFLEAQDQD